MHVKANTQGVANAREIISANSLINSQQSFVARCDQLIVSILVFLILFSPMAFGAVDSWAYSLIRLGILIMLVAWLLRSACIKQFQITFPSFWIPSILFLVFLIVQLIPLPFWLRELLSPLPLNHSLLLPAISSPGHNPQDMHWTQITLYPPATWEGLIDFCTCLILVWIVLNTVILKEKQRTVLFSIVAIGSFEAVYGLFEYLSGRQGIFFFNKVYYRGDVTGTYINHNHFAGLLELTIPIFVALMWTALPNVGNVSGSHSTIISTQKGNRRLKFYAGLGLLAIICISLVLSHSRGGIISSGISMLMLFILLFRFKMTSHNSLTMPVRVVVFLVVIFLGGELFTRFSFFLRDASDRIDLWNDAKQIASDFPLWGTGLGTFRYVIPNYRHKMDILLVDGIPRRAAWDFAHNDYLQLLVECGILGLILAGWAIADWSRHFFAALLTTPDRSDRVVRCGLGCSVVAMLIHSFVDFNLRIPANAILFTICLTLATTYGNSQSKVMEEVA